LIILNKNIANSLLKYALTNSQLVVYLTGPEGLCVELWYFMYGRDVGNLTIYFSTGGGAYEEKVWMRTGDRGPQWYYAQVSNYYNYCIYFYVTIQYSKAL